MKRQPRPETARPKTTTTRPEAGRSAEDRAGYRRLPGPAGSGSDKRTDVGPGAANLEFVSILFFIYYLKVIRCY